MEGLLKGNGKAITCMVMECILGRMAEDMRATMNKIRKMVMEYMCGQMGGDTKEIGIMVNNMAKEGIYCQMRLLK
jgi:hypothetical protein